MRLVRFALGLMLIGAGVGAAVAQMPALRGGAMLDCSGLPCVDMTLANGRQLRMLIDTGDAQSILDAGVAKALGLTVEPVTDADGKVIPRYAKTTVTGAKIGDGALGEMKMLVMDLAGPMKKNQMPTADGTLAYTAFKNRVLEMDYPGKRVVFSEPLTSETACPAIAPARCETLTTPTFGKQGPPILVATGFTMNGKPITAQIDTLYSGTMLIYPTSVEKLGLAEMAKSTKQRMFHYTDGGVGMLEAGPVAEAFEGQTLGKHAPIYFATPDVHLPDGMFDGTVGHELFEHSVLVMDLKGMRVWMKG